MKNEKTDREVNSEKEGPVTKNALCVDSETPDKDIKRSSADRCGVIALTLLNELLVQRIAHRSVILVRPLNRIANERVNVLLHVIQALGPDEGRSAQLHGEGVQQHLRRDAHLPREAPHDVAVPDPTPRAPRQYPEQLIRHPPLPERGSTWVASRRRTRDSSFEWNRFCTIDGLTRASSRSLAR